MNLLKLEDIAIKGEGKLLGTPLDLKVKGVSIDSRTLEKGELFLALKGPYSDGHDFLKEALKRGASSFVVEKKVESNNPYILVKDSYRFLNLLAKKTRAEFQGNLVGVTGSNGKTSTKEIIFSLLSAEGICHKTLGNRNNQIGVPLSLSSLNDENTARDALYGDCYNHENNTKERKSFAHKTLHHYTIYIGIVNPKTLENFRKS